MRLEDNQTAAKLYIDNNNADVTLDELKSLLKALREERRALQCINGTPMYKMYVISAAVQDILNRIRYKESEPQR